MVNLLILQISLIWPVVYLLFWAFLVVFSLYSKPVVCSVGLAILTTGVPVYFIGVYWENKPKCFNVFIGKATSWSDTWCESLLVQTINFPGVFHYYLYPGKMTHLSQKLCLVVYPVSQEEMDPTEGDGNSPQEADGCSNMWISKYGQCLPSLKMWINLHVHLIYNFLLILSGKEWNILICKLYLFTLQCLYYHFTIVKTKLIVQFNFYTLIPLNKKHKY